MSFNSCKIQNQIHFSVNLHIKKHSEFITELFLIELGGVHFFLSQEHNKPKINFHLFFNPLEEKKAKIIVKKIKEKVDELNHEETCFKFW